MDEIDMLERARDDELWQVRASVILDDKGDGCVVEQAARHGWVIDIIRGGLTPGSEVRDYSPGTTLDKGDECAKRLHNGPWSAGPGRGWWSWGLPVTDGR